MAYKCQIIILDTMYKLYLDVSFEIGSVFLHTYTCIHLYMYKCTYCMYSTYVCLMYVKPCIACLSCCFQHEYSTTHRCSHTSPRTEVLNECQLSIVLMTCQVPITYYITDVYFLKIQLIDAHIPEHDNSLLSIHSTVTLPHLIWLSTQSTFIMSVHMQHLLTDVYLLKNKMVLSKGSAHFLETYISKLME